MNLLQLPLTSLSRVGPTLSKFLTRLVGDNKIIDLLLHKPLRIESVSILPRIFETQNNELAILKLKVESYLKPQKARQPFKVTCYSPSGYVSLVFFKIFPSQLNKMAIGSEIAVLGTIQKNNGETQIIHPSKIVPSNQINSIAPVNVIYPLATAVSQQFLTEKIHEALAKLPNSTIESIDSHLIKEQEWPNFYEALKNLHHYNKRTSQTDWEKSRQRLAYDELLAWQLATLIAKNKGQKHKKTTEITQDLSRDFLNNLPFRPTNAQVKAIDEINNEISSNKKMLRLLQGDVGSGKTIVAIAACMQALSHQKQACLIVPTTVLAKQHFGYFKEMLSNFEINIELITSANTKKQKEKIIENLNNNKIDILIGTHAILEDNISFNNLGLAIIDEQHRFGVIQRLKLVEKGQDVDVLLMSATPIPRSLMMGLYGDMDISILNEKPKNRRDIETLVMSENKISDIFAAINRTIKRNEKIYWVCPAIEENDEIQLNSANEKFEQLKTIFEPKNIALIHGKMKDKEKEQIMAEFADGNSDLKILVSTTVIEVGLDVPLATVIVIENSEHFGLAQLHQLRGRVGRNDKQSYCILLYGLKYGKNARQRLNILRQSNDGFFIAEEDLKIRGSGELLGTKQSGFPEFRIADLSIDSNLLKIAHSQAKIILDNSNNLENDKALAYRNLLQIFGYDQCLKNIKSG